MNKFSNLNISSKIILGNALVFAFFLTSTFLYVQSLKEDKKILEKLSHITKNTNIILDINKEVSELQRLVMVYSGTGGDAVLDKIKASHSLLAKRLDDFELGSSFNKYKEQIKSLRSILSSFGKNIGKLESLYRHKNDLINTKIPLQFSTGESLIERALKKSKTDIEKIRLQKLSIDWQKANLFTMNFLEKKNFDFKNKYHETMITMKEVLKEVNLEDSDYDELYGVINNHKQLFDKAIQANRMYLLLVNVVMAGASIEFSKSSEILKNDIVNELTEILKNSDRIYIENRDEVFLLLGLTLIFLAGVSFYYHFNIANGIKDISDTFKLFISGDFTERIPGINRKDEIGQLAKAANTFKEYSSKLKEEQEKAEESTKSKSRFLAIMSHEIRTPMNAILSCTNILLDGENSLETRQMLSTIKTSGDSLLVLINDILDFSKIESGKIKLENTVFSLKECVESVVDLLVAKASHEGVYLSISQESDYPDYIYGDVTRLRQVLVNLVGNGIKFSRDKVVIDIQTEPLESSNKVNLTFKVTDNGIGIPDKFQKNLFRDFSQVDASTTRRFGGTGLGLAISKGIIDSMGGEINVTSTKGKGAEFCFVIQVVKEERSAPSSTVPLSLELQEESFDLKLKILLVEDNSVNQLVAKKMLKKMGFSPDVASNGLEAVQMVKSVSYDLILMDQHMPELDGLEATRKIRSLNIKQPLIYALTASAFLEDKERCINSGMDGFLTKPIIVEELKRTIKHASELK